MDLFCNNLDKLRCFNSFCLAVGTSPIHFNIYIISMRMGFIRMFQIRSNDISIERARQADPHSKMALECCSVTEIWIFEVQNVPNLWRVYENGRGKICTRLTPSCMRIHEGVTQVRIFPYTRLRFGSFWTLKIDISVTGQHASQPFWNGGQLDELFQ